MRDIRRNKEYFNTYLDYQYSRIEKKIAKLREYKDDEEKNREFYFR